jgi:hypothetical protein
LALVVAESGQETVLLCSGAIAASAAGADALAASGAACVGVGTRVFLGGAEARVTHVLAGGIGLKLVLPPAKCVCGAHWGDASDALSPSSSSSPSQPIPAGTALFRVPAAVDACSASSDALPGTSITVTNPIVMGPPPATTLALQSGIDSNATCESFGLSLLGVPASRRSALQPLAGFHVGCDLPALLVSHRAAAPALLPGERLGGCLSGVLDAAASRHLRDIMRLIPQAAAPSIEASSSSSPAPGTAALAMDVRSRHAAAAISVGASYTARCTGFPPPGSLCKDPEAVAAGLVCAYGQGSACRACPSAALCPGGFVALPTRGWWNDESSRLQMLVRCAEPSTTRCLGWSDATGSAECGVGFEGYACGECSSGFFPDEVDGCVACPQGQPIELLICNAGIFKDRGQPLPVSHETK